MARRNHAPKGSHGYSHEALSYMGYKAYPALASRPHCDMCGPWRAMYLRPAGAEMRCIGCDCENED